MAAREASVFYLARWRGVLSQDSRRRHMVCSWSRRSFGLPPGLALMSWCGVRTLHIVVDNCSRRPPEDELSTHNLFEIRVKNAEREQPSSPDPQTWATVPPAFNLRAFPRVRGKSSYHMKASSCIC